MECATWSRSNWGGTSLTDCEMSRSGVRPSVAVLLVAGEPS